MNPLRHLTAPTLVVLAALAITPQLAGAGVPTPWTSTVPTHAVLVGTSSTGAADPMGTITVIARRFDVPVAGCMVVLDFSDTPGLKLCNPQQDASQVLDCGPGSTNTIRGFADNNGAISFTLSGHADRCLPDAQAPTLRIYADGVLFGTIPLAAFDQDGDGIGAADQSLWLSDYFAAQYFQRSDFDGDGILGPADLSKWLTAFFEAGSILGCPGAVCP